MNELVQATFDYSDLDAGTRVFIQEQAQAIRILVKRTAEDIVTIGIRLLEVKERLGHGKFMGWVQSELELSQMTAVKFMRVAETHAKFKLDLNLPASVLYEISAPSTSDTVVGMVQTGEIPPTLEAIKEAKEKERLARAEAELAQQQLLELQQEMETLSKPEVIQVDTPETVARIMQLERQRDNLKELAEGLSADLKAIEEETEAKRERELHDLRIRQEWQKNAKAVFQSVTQFLTRLPLPIEAQVLEPDDWVRYDQVIEAFENGIAACINWHRGVSSRVIEAGVIADVSLAT